MGCPNACDRFVVRASTSPRVLAGLGPAIHDFAGAVPKAWVPGPSPGMTVERLVRAGESAALVLSAMNTSI